MSLAESKSLRTLAKANESASRRRLKICYCKHCRPYLQVFSAEYLQYAPAVSVQIVAGEDNTNYVVFENIDINKDPEEVAEASNGDLGIRMGSSNCEMWNIELN